MHVVTQGISPRTRQEGRLIRHGAEGFRVTADGHGDAGPLSLEVRAERGGGKKALANGAPVESLDRLRSRVATLVFTPDRLALVKSGPAVRRTYVDRVFGRLFPARAGLPADYAEALAQRNAALRRAGAGLAGPEIVEPWTEQVASRGAELSAARAAALQELAPGFAERAGELGLADARLAYEPSSGTVDELAARLPLDLERGLTGAGPHLDEVRLSAAGHDLRAHGSQGEQRVAVLALLLAEAELLSARRPVPPLLLLDDVLSELDGERRAALVGRVRSSGQALVTAAVRGALPGDPDQLLSVTPGRVAVA